MEQKNLRDYLYRLAKETEEIEVKKFLNNTNHKIWKKLEKAAGKGQTSIHTYISEWEAIGLRRLGLHVYYHRRDHDYRIDWNNDN